jgi:hypothetical protein
MCGLGAERVGLMLPCRRVRVWRPARQPVFHPSDEDLSLGTPVFHPSDEDLSLGTPVFHPRDEDLSLGTPVFHPRDEDLSLGAPVGRPVLQRAPAREGVTERVR